MELETPYLDAIQAIPGNTPGEKFAWMGRLIKERTSECNSLEEVLESDKIPRLLAPLLRVQAVLAISKKNRENQSIHGAVTEALKSEDTLIVNRALQVTSFFDGSNKNVTNVKYFFNHVFPYVSLNTRTRIIKKLSIHLATREPGLAEEFFRDVDETYGLEHALPLLLACSESFIYKTIVERRIVLSRRFVKIMYRRNPDLMVRFFRLSKPSTDPYARNLYQVVLFDFCDYLAALIRNRLDSFVELYEMHEEAPPNIVLSMTRARAFLKNGKEHLQRNPKLYIKLLPLRLISASQMEEIYSKLFPENIKGFSTDQMLHYLDCYPEEKKLDLFVNAYREVYGKSVLNEPKYVTSTLMRMLPVEERVRQARIKLEEADVVGKMDYTHAWRCYLTTSEAIPEINSEIARMSDMDQRADLVCQMIYCCKVNQDDQALLQVLTYVRDRHKNEQPMFLLKMFNCLLELYDNLPQLGDDQWQVLMDILVRAYVKNELPPSHSVSMKILENAVHHKLIRDEPIDQLISILVDVKITRYSGHWNILTKYPEYERRCLDACLAVVSQKYKSDKTPWKEDKVGILFDLFTSIYHFNDEHVKKNSRIERMSVKSYPWLVNEIEDIIATDDVKNIYIIESFCNLLEKHERDLFGRFCKKKKDAEEIDLAKALACLKKNPERILANWRQYLKICEVSYNRGSMKRFVKALRWHKEIPIRFVEQCIRDLAEQKKEICLIMLAVLVHGETLAKIIEPLLPSEKTIDTDHEEARSNYKMICYAIDGMKIANPPIPLSMISRLCGGDYLSLALSAMTNVCRRTSVMKVISFANTLADQRVSVKKHGIRLLHLVAPRNQFCEFLFKLWQSEKNSSIQEIVIAKASQLFQEEPGDATWHVFSQIVSTLRTTNESAIPKLIGMVARVENVYVENFIKLLLRSIDNLAEAGLQQNIVNSFICSLLRNINGGVCALLPEEFIEELLRRFLFHPEPTISRSASTFVVTAYLLPAREELDARMKKFSDVFVETVKKGWSVPHPRNPHFYPVNHAVQGFVDNLMSTAVHRNVDPPMIDGILKMFLTVITPQMEPASYLLLVYTKEYVITRTPKEFGIKLGEKVQELVQTYTPLFMPFILKTLKYFLGMNAFSNWDEEDTKLGIIEGLMGAASIEATLMAVNLLSPPKSREDVDRYDKVVMMIAECDHPAVRSTLCHVINSVDYTDIS